MPEILLKIDTEELLNDIREIIRQEITTALQANQPSAIEELVTLDKLLEVIHISQPTFNRLRKKYNIPVYHVGRRILFKITEVVEALQAKNYIRYKTIR